jgi:vacuolar-type H+-ATPase subunit E/Vma4
MKSVEERMQVLARAVLNEAQAEARQILADAQEKAEAIRQRGRERAAAERAETLEQTRREAGQIREQAIAAAQLKARMLRLEQREKLLNHVFEAVQQRLPAVQQWTDYEQIVQELIREAVLDLGTQAVRIRADAQADQLLTEEVLARLARELDVTLEKGASLGEGIGIVAETIDGRRQYDNTLQARLRRSREELRAPVYHLLMGEPL